MSYAFNWVQQHLGSIFLLRDDDRHMISIWEMLTVKFEPKADRQFGCFLLHADMSWLMEISLKFMTTSSSFDVINDFSPRENSPRQAQWHHIASLNAENFRRFLLCPARSLKPDSEPLNKHCGNHFRTVELWSGSRDYVTIISFAVSRKILQCQCQSQYGVNALDKKSRGTRKNFVKKSAEVGW